MAIGAKLTPGTVVDSIRVGRKAAFTGVVVERAPGGWNVRDPRDGTLWLRGQRELTIKDTATKEAAE